jgi:hypothetical protein
MRWYLFDSFVIRNNIISAGRLDRHCSTHYVWPVGRHYIDIANRIQANLAIKMCALAARTVPVGYCRLCTVPFSLGISLCWGTMIRTRSW